VTESHGQPQATIRYASQPRRQPIDDCIRDGCISQRPAAPIADYASQDMSRASFHSCRRAAAASASFRELLDADTPLPGFRQPDLAIIRLAADCE